MRTLLLSALLLAGCVEADPTYPEGEDACRRQVQVRVVEFVDGDSGVVEFLGDREGETEEIRLNGIDTPEAGECWSSEASAALDVFEGELVWMTFDTECTGVFGRTLVYLFQDDGGLFINHHMVLEGHTPAFFPDYSLNRTFEAEFLEGEERAASESKGGWGTCQWQLGGVGT